MQEVKHRLKLVIRETGELIAEQLSEAYTFRRRLKGLMGTNTLPEGVGLHIRPCKSVHSFFMKYDIDVLHLNKDGQVVGTEYGLKPGRIGSVFRGTESVVELPAGTLERFQVRNGHHVQMI